MSVNVAYAGFENEPSHGLCLVNGYPLAVADAWQRAVALPGQAARVLVLTPKSGVFDAPCACF